MLINLIELKSQSISRTNLNKVIEGRFGVESDDSRYCRLWRKNNGSAKPTFYSDLFDWLRACATKGFHTGTCSFISYRAHYFTSSNTTFPENLVNAFFKFVLFANKPFANKSKVSVSLVG